jgi:hypothetical protein
MIDYVGEISRYILKIILIACIWWRLLAYVNYNVSHDFFLVPASYIHARRTVDRLNTHDGSNDADFRKDLPFGNLADMLINAGV